MLSRLIVPLALGAALLAGPASAGAYGHASTLQSPMTMSDADLHDECAALELQFDRHALSGEDAHLGDPAGRLREDGGALCAAGHSGAGIAKLKAALKQIGAQPQG